MRVRLATAVELSEASKLGPVSATYVGQITCPPDCPYRNDGCYAEAGRVGIHTRHLDQPGTALEAIRQEAAAIDKLSGSRPLRLHVVGDCLTNQQARLLAAAARRYAKQEKEIKT